MGQELCNNEFFFFLCICVGVCVIYGSVWEREGRGESFLGRKCFEVTENSRSFLLKGLGFNVSQECVSVRRERRVSRVSLPAGERG